MQVDDLRQENDGDWINVSGRLTWEDCDRPPDRILLRVDSALADDLECSANAFLVAVAAPAMRYGERRIAVDGQICPVLRDGIFTVLTQLREWYDPTRILPAIEASQGFGTRVPRTPGRGCMFLSGGVDALATLRRNRLMYPKDQPRAVKDAFYVFGVHPFDYRAGGRCPKRYAAWERAGNRLREFAADQGIELLRCETNLNAVFDDEIFGDQEYFSAILFAFAHLFTSRVRDVFIASSDCIADLSFGPYGSHPLIDPYYSSSALRIHHDGIRLNRLEKVRLLAEWPEAIEVLNVCINEWYDGEFINCGYCRKCVRTRIELLISGCLDKAETFPTRELRAEEVAKLELRNEHDARYLRECLPGLLAIGRHDLAEGIEICTARLERRISKKQSRLRSLVKQIDSSLTGGMLRRSWRSRKRNTD